MNFFQNPDYKRIFSGSLDVNHLTMLIGAVIGKGAVFVPGETVIIFDEIQECPEARTSLKFFALDGRFDVIGTGSLLGVNGYGTQPSSIPVGYETVIDMDPLDFEEFLWANGIDDAAIEYVRACLKEEKPVADAIHTGFRELLLNYIVVGGMPEAVQMFVDTHDLRSVLQVQRDIVRGYEDDMVKYASKTDKTRIRECYRSIPKQLAKENRKFRYSVVKKGSNSSQYADILQWIEDAGMICRCYNLSVTELPLEGNYITCARIPALRLISA